MNLFGLEEVFLFLNYKNGGIYDEWLNEMEEK
jgi:hypothetical protein